MVGAPLPDQGRWFRRGPNIVAALGDGDLTPAVAQDHEIAGPAAPLPKGSACAYFFKGASYVRYNIATDAVDVGPAAIRQFWPHLPAEFQTRIDAAVNWGDGHAYFFKGERYVRYNIATDTVDVGPAPIRQFWTRLPAEFHRDIDAAVNWGDGHAYFFKGERYLRYDIATDMVDVGPAPIRQFWTRLPAQFHSNIDAAVNWGDGKAYFFKGAGYVRYDIRSDMVDVGPAPIAKFWKGLPPEFHRDIGAGVNWTYPADIAALLRAAGATVNEVRDWRSRAARGGFTPIGIVMHHTVSTNSLADIVANRKANFHVEKSGLINVVSGGRANHAGLGARQVLDEVSGGVAPPGTALQRNLRDGPVGNGFFYGFENENLGDGIDPWPEAQLDAMATGAAALCQRHCWSANRVISHAEWTRRKIDPRGIDMNDFRARVAELL